MLLYEVAGIVIAFRNSSGGGEPRSSRDRFKGTLFEGSSSFSLTVRNRYIAPRLVLFCKLFTGKGLQRTFSAVRVGFLCLVIPCISSKWLRILVLN